MKPFQLRPQDLDTIRLVAEHEVITVEQIHEALFPGLQIESTYRLIRRLCQHGFVDFTFYKPPLKKGTPYRQRGRSVKVLFWREPCRTVLRKYFHTNGQASAWDMFEQLDTTHHNSQRLTSPFYDHEKGVTEIALRLKKACELAGVDLVFWERVGKKSAHALYVDPDTKKWHFEPDGMFCLRKNGIHFFYLVEYDNDSEEPYQYVPKYEAHREYYRQQLFLTRLFPFFNTKYQLKITNPRNAYLVLTVAPNETRRNKLFYDCLAVESYRLLWFASLDDLKPETFFSNVWLRGKEWSPLAPQLETLDKEPNKATRDALIAQMERVALLGA